MNKILSWFVNLIRIILPKTELEKNLSYISALNTNPDNYGKISMIYLKLHTMYAVMIGKHGDDTINFYYAQFFYNLHKDYRERYFEHKLKQNEKY
jgi:hypothetical protein